MPNTTVLAGVTIGEFSMTGIGSVITRDLKSYGLYYGNPAKQNGWVDEYGEKLAFDSAANTWKNKTGEEYVEGLTGLQKK